LVNMLIDRARNARLIDLLNFQKGCKDLKIALSLARELSHNELIAKSLALISRCIYSKDKDVKSSLVLLNEAFSIAKNQQLPNNILSVIYNQAAVLYAQLAMYDKAYEYNILAYDIYQEANNSFNSYIALINLISNSITSGKFEQANKHLKQLEQFALEQTNFKDALLKYYYFSARVAQEQNNWPLSIFLLEKAIAELDNAKQAAYIQTTYERMSFSYFRLGDINKTKKYLSIRDNIYLNKKVIVKELIAIKHLLESKPTNALNASFELINAERKKKYDFIKLSTANLAQAYDDNLKQLNNVLLEQRLTYMLIFTIVAVLILTTFAYIQFQRRLLAKKKSLLIEETLDTKNKLLADVSHELRTPLTVLQIEIETLQHDFSENIEESYESLRNKIHEINYLIDDISELARSDSGHVNFIMAVTELRPLFKSTEIELEHLVISKGFSWQSSINIPLEASLLMDENRIKQVFTNIVNNSIKYTDKPGLIKMDVLQQGQELIITITDSAPSVKIKELSKIFERLYRVDSSRCRKAGGSGLGLSICKMIIEKHGGEIYAQQNGIGGLSIIIKLFLQN